MGKIKFLKEIKKYLFFSCFELKVECESDIIENLLVMSKI